MIFLFAKDRRGSIGGGRRHNEALPSLKEDTPGADVQYLTDRTVEEDGAAR